MGSLREAQSKVGKMIQAATPQHKKDMGVLFNVIRNMHMSEFFLLFSLALKILKAFLSSPKNIKSLNPNKNSPSFSVHGPQPLIKHTQAFGRQIKHVPHHWTSNQSSN